MHLDEVNVKVMVTVKVKTFDQRMKPGVPRRCISIWTGCVGFG